MCGGRFSFETRSCKFDKISMMFPISEYMVGAVDGSEEFCELMIVKDMMRNKMAWAG